jgi:integrase
MAQPFDLSSQLARENRKLDHCSLTQRKNSLYLRATLPRRQDPSTKGQTSMALGLTALPENLKKAVELARLLDDQLHQESFSWALWEPSELSRVIKGNPAHSITVAEFRSGIESVFDQKYPETPKSWDTIWGKKYKPAINVLAQLNGLCSENLLIEALEQVAAPSSRKSHASIFNETNRKLRLGFSREAITEAGAGYTRAELKPRDIPTDDELLSYWSKIKLPQWRWMFGVVMAYGIRPHEIVNCQMRAEGILEVSSDTKTGRREVWACPAEWVQELELERIYRPTQKKEQVSRACNDYIRDQGIPIPLYAARHAYAIRMLSHGVSSDVGAKLMGHSPQMHTTTYRQWIDDKHMYALRQRIGHKFRRDGGTD